MLLQGDSLIDLVEGRRLGYWRNRITVSEEPFAMLRGAPAHNLAEHVTGSLFFRGRQFISSRAFGPDLLPAALRLRAFDLTAEREEASMLFSALPDLYLKYRFMRTLSLVQGENMAAWKSWTRDSRASEHAVDPEAVEQLKALGYID